MGSCHTAPTDKVWFNTTHLCLRMTSYLSSLWRVLVAPSVHTYLFALATDVLTHTWIVRNHVARACSFLLILIRPPDVLLSLFSVGCRAWSIRTASNGLPVLMTEKLPCLKQVYTAGTVSSTDMSVIYTGNHQQWFCLLYANSKGRHVSTLSMYSSQSPELSERTRANIASIDVTQLAQNWNNLGLLKYVFINSFCRVPKASLNL